MIDLQHLELTDSITPEEYMNMRQIVGWSTFPLEEAEAGLAGSAYLCCIRKDGAPIAMSRYLWDHGYVVYIADVIVTPEYQGQGLGRFLMERMMADLRSNLKPGYRMMVNLMAAKGKEPFYNKFGFIDRPSEAFGCGCHRFTSISASGRNCCSTKWPGKSWAYLYPSLYPSSSISFVGALRRWSGTGRLPVLRTVSSASPMPR